MAATPEILLVLTLLAGALAGFAFAASEAAAAVARSPCLTKGRLDEGKLLVAVGAAAAVTMFLCLVTLGGSAEAATRLTAALRQPLERNLIFFQAALDVAVSLYMAHRARQLKAACRR